MIYAQLVPTVQCAVSVHCTQFSLQCTERCAHFSCPYLPEVVQTNFQHCQSKGSLKAVANVENMANTANISNEANIAPFWKLAVKPFNIMSTRWHQIVATPFTYDISLTFNFFNSLTFAKHFLHIS